MQPSRVFYVGIDSGIRGGGGLCILDSEGDVLATRRVQRTDEMSELDIIVKTVNEFAGMLKRLRYDDETDYLYVGREDHNFLGQPERFSRNVLRRINGAIDYACVWGLNLEGGVSYFAFPPGTWKAIAGIPGDIGKASRGRKKGQRAVKGKKLARGNEAYYLAKINECLGAEHTNHDIADAHGVAEATRRVILTRDGMLPFSDHGRRVRDAMWDQKKALGKTRAAMEKHMGGSIPPGKAHLFMRSFQP